MHLCAKNLDVRDGREKEDADARKKVGRKTGKKDERGEKKKANDKRRR